MDARRLELYELLKPKLDEEPARALVLALPAEAERLPTKDDLAGLALKSDVVAVRGELTARIDVGFAQVESRFAQMESRLAQLEATLTRRMVTIMGAWTIVIGSTVGWVSALLR